MLEIEPDLLEPQNPVALATEPWEPLEILTVKLQSYMARQRFDTGLIA